MARCNLKPTDDCYGCPYWGTGDMEGCELTINFHKFNPDGTAHEYAEYMAKHNRKDGNI